MLGCLKFAYEVPNQTTPNWIALNHTMLSQPRPALTNRHVTSPLFWDIMQCWVATPCQHFGTTYRSHLQGSRNPKERKQHDWVNWQSSFLGPVHHLVFLKKHNIQKPVLFPISDKEAPNLVYTLDSPILHHRNSNLLRYAPENKSSPRVVTGKLIKN